MKEILSNNIPVNPTKLWEGVPLFNILDSLKVIKYCKENEIAILGIEGFKIDGNKRIPDMECIVDFSSLLKKNPNTFVADSVKISENFIKEINNTDILLELLLVKI